MKREDLRVGGVYKHCKYPLFIACISLGEHGSLEGMALNNYNDIYQGDICRSWFIPSFEPFDIGLSLEQGKCKDDIKGGNLNYWRKVSEELPNNGQLVLVKTIDNTYHTANYDANMGDFYSASMYELDDCELFLIDGIVEWKPID